MRKFALVLSLAVTLASALPAAELPRKAPALTIALPGGKKANVADYKGKEVCLILFLTTCPHCQAAIKVLNGIQKDFGPKGFQVLAAAMNEDANLPKFASDFHTNYPVGMIDALTARAYMQIGDNEHGIFAPFILFIDRAGNIQSQYTGRDPILANEADEDQNLRAEVTKYLGKPNHSPVHKEVSKKN